MLSWPALAWNDTTQMPPSFQPDARFVTAQLMGLELGERVVVVLARPPRLAQTHHVVSPRYRAKLGL